MSSLQKFEQKAIPFGERLANSAAFRALFKEGMALVEETAAYLDGEGRDEARLLPRMAGLTYASESMRLTTRLMQIASWLLLQRAVNEGEMTQTEAAADMRRTRTAWQQPTPASLPDDALPPVLRELIEKSLRLQQRIVRLDSLILEGPKVSEVAVPHPLEGQLAALRAAFPVACQAKS